MFANHRSINNRKSQKNKKIPERRLSINPVTLVITTDNVNEFDNEEKAVVVDSKEIQDKKKSIKRKVSTNEKAIRTGMNIVFETFKTGDGEGNYGIDAEKLLAVFEDIGDCNISLEQCRDILKEADTDGNGKVELVEFLHFFVNNICRIDDTEEDLVDAFEIFEPYKSGFLSAQELRTYLTNLGDEFNDNEIDKFISIADLDNDGIINYEALSKLIFQKEKQFRDLEKDSES